MSETELAGKGGVGEPKMLPYIWDSADGYANVLLPDYARQRSESELDAFWKPKALKRYIETEPFGRPEHFLETWWPAERRRLAERSLKSRRIVAVLDSGVLGHHPQIGPVLDDAKDFTGHDDWTDRDGHGTMCALLATEGMTQVRLRVGKVWHEECGGTVGQLICGLEWLAGMDKSEESEDMFASLSIGYPTTNFGLLQCRGTCKLCRAAEECARSGVVLFCSTGNDPSRVTCPASNPHYRASELEKDSVPLFEVGSYDFDGGGPSNGLEGPGTWSFGPFRDRKAWL